MRDRRTTLRARALRQDSTVAERLLWEELRGSKLNGWKFRRQSGVANYVVDFLCHSPKLIVELDGPAHDDLEQAQFDKKRDAEIEALGFSVMRMNERLVREDMGMVLASITFVGKRRLEGLSPYPAADES